jgi:hypothetical protein
VGDWWEKKNEPGSERKKKIIIIIDVRKTIEFNMPESVH